MIDTAAKRASILGFGSGDLLPIPDGTIAAADRLTFLWLYSGIAATAPIVMIPGLQFTMDNDNLEFTVERAPDFTTEDW